MRERFSPASDSPELDAQVLLTQIIKKTRTWILAHTEYELTSCEKEACDHAISKIEFGIPLPYILGHWEFYGREYLITPDVLIPRPETELMVEKALVWLKEYASKADDILAADIGCGSGCIGISLAAEIPNLHIISSDISWAAVNVALQNAARHSVTSHLHIVQCDLIPPINRPLQVICANLPYIPTSTLTRLDVYKKEPTLALDGGMDGLYLIEPLLSISPHFLAKRGLILLEIESTITDKVTKLSHDAFPNAAINVFQDLSGHDRLIAIQQGK
ncbi:MAG: peptide chain release factor N(5)-glutamine methyltransferase [Anaerolineales bacterium]|nr:peptide chain release factor N(5)-glutamine methyltransferase [Anaerolineales bacterium]